MPRSTLIVVRSIVDEPGLGARPTLPVAWDWQIDADGWVTLWPLGRVVRVDVYAHACLVVRDSGNPTRGCWVIVGPRAMLDLIEASGNVRSWRTLSDLRADGGAVATAIKSQWPSWEPGTTFRQRIAGFLDDDAET